jgi:hypothetical protein
MMNIVTDLIKTLPGSSSVNTIDCVTIEETVFSMSSAPSNSKNGVLCDQLLGTQRFLNITVLLMWSVSRLYDEIPRIFKYKRLELRGGQVYDRSSD